MENIARNIKKLRKLHGLSQMDLGYILGVSDKAVSSWETGKCLLPFALAIHLSKEFEVSLDTLVGSEIDSELDITVVKKRIEELEESLDRLKKSLTLNGANDGGIGNKC